MPEELLSYLREQASTIRTPDGTVLPTLRVDRIEDIAARYSMAGKDVEIAALKNGILPLRYLRNLQTYSMAEQARLLKSRVAVVGLGGLGGTVTEILARSGVGSLILIDGDTFEEHNLNRQLLCTRQGIGRSKARAAAQRVGEMNGSLVVTAHEEHLTAENAGDLLKGSQIVVDCLDSIASRFMLAAAAKEAGLPLVSGAVAGLCGQVTTIYPQDPGMASIYGPLENLQSPKGAEMTLGCLPQAVLLIASMEAAEVLKVLLGKTQQVLHERLMMVDLSDNTFEILRLT